MIFERNLGLVTAVEQARLATVTVAIPGTGGVGGWHALTLARQGVGRFRLADFDTYSVSNVNRQPGAFASTLGEAKVDVIRRMILDINPGAEVTVLREPIGPANVHDFLAGADVVLDGIDFFAIDARRLVFRVARELGIWALTAGPMGFSAAMLAFSPTSAMSFDDYFDFPRCADVGDQLIAFAVGLAPAGLHVPYMDMSTVKLESGRGPSSVIACQLCGSLLAMETLALVLGWREPFAAPGYTQIDLRTTRLRRGRLRGGNAGPFQRLKRFAFRRLLERRGVDVAALDARPSSAVA
jgi:molybdopterin/thiamine biosynthesis adenylyltransferase